MGFGSVQNKSANAENVSYDNTSTSSIITGDNVQEAIDQLFTSVSNGKTEIASAITDKGVSTSADASFATMAENIGKISTGFTVTHDFQTSGEKLRTGYTLWENLFIFPRSIRAQGTGTYEMGSVGVNVDYDSNSGVFNINYTSGGLFSSYPNLVAEIYYID